MSQLFDRIIALIEKTGDCVVVYEKTTDKAVVVMPFENYESLLAVSGQQESSVNLPDTDLLDRINAELKDTIIMMPPMSAPGSTGEEEYLIEPAN